MRIFFVVFELDFFTFKYALQNKIVLFSRKVLKNTQ